MSATIIRPSGAGLGQGGTKDATQSEVRREQGFMRSSVILAPLLMLPARASQPVGPTVAVMPGRDKSFEAFREDQALCRQLATDEVEGGAQHANTMQVATGVLGAGAAFGDGRGAAIGAGAGALGGAGLGGFSTARVHDSPAGTLRPGLFAVHDHATQSDPGHECDQGHA
jgi:hypothetical protein